MMTKTEAVEYMTDIMAKFVGYSGKVLPDDVTEKLKELRYWRQMSFPRPYMTPCSEIRNWRHSWTVPAVRIQEFCSIW